MKSFNLPELYPDFISIEVPLGTDSRVVDMGFSVETGPTIIIEKGKRRIIKAYPEFSYMEGDYFYNDFTKNVAYVLFSTTPLY